MEPTEDGILECPSCGMEIIIIKTTEGESVPVDATRKAVESARVNLELQRSELTPHFATCPNAQVWRTP